MATPLHPPALASQGHQEALPGKVGEHRPSPRRRLSFTAACLTILGLAIGRFATTPSGQAAPAPSAKPVQSLIAVSPDAVPSLEAAVKANPADVRGLQQLAVAYTRRAAEGDPSNYDLADRTLQRAEAIAADDPLTMVARATLDLSLHEFDRAREQAIAIQTQNPDLNDVDTVLVDASVELGRYEEAQKYLQKLVDRRAALPSYARVSYLRELHGDLDGAATAMQLAINAGQPGSPDVAAVTTLLGDIEFSRGRLTAARTNYERALRMKSSLPLATLGIARIDGAQGQLDRAIADLKNMTQVYPLPAAVVLLGDLQQQSGDLAGAEESFALVDAITTLQQNAGEVVDLETAQFDLDHGRLETGVAFAETAFSERPNNIFVADALAWARFRQGKFTEAAALSTQAIRLGTHDAGMLFHAAAIAEANGKLEAAVRLLKRSLSLNRYQPFSVRAERDALATKLGIKI